MTNFNFADPEFESQLRSPGHPNHRMIVWFLTHLALCHTVVIQHKHESDPADSDRSVSDQVREVYSAQSPDELALVNAAKHFGVSFRARPTPKSILVEHSLPSNQSSPASVLQTPL